MQKLSEVVAGQLDQVNKRNGKIRERIASLQAEAAEVQKNVEKLTRDLVDFDLAEDPAGQARANKEIGKLRGRLTELLDQLKAYQGTLDDPAIIKRELPKIFALVRKERDERLTSLERKMRQLDQLNEEAESIAKQIALAENEANALRHNTEVRHLLLLLKYIEPRAIRRGHEERFLTAILDGVTGELLEQHLEIPKDIAAPRVTYFNREPGTLA